MVAITLYGLWVYMKKKPSALVVLEEPFFLSQNQYYCELNWWRFGSKLAEYFGEFGLFVPLAKKEPPVNAQLVVNDRLNIYPRFYYKRTEECFRLLLTQKRELLKQARAIHLKVGARTTGVQIVEEMIERLNVTMDKPK